MVPEIREVHVIASGEVRIVPFAPTATNCVPDQVTPCRPFKVPEVREVHVIPSGEVRILPPSLFPPTATNWVPDQITPEKPPIVVSDTRNVTGIPVTVIGA